MLAHQKGISTHKKRSVRTFALNFPKRRGAGKEKAKPTSKKQTFKVRVIYFTTSDQLLSRLVLSNAAKLFAVLLPESVFHF